MSEYQVTGKDIRVGSPEVARITGHAMLVAAVAAIGGFLFGFDTAVINGAVNSIQSQYHVGNVVLGLAVSSALIGSAVGALGAGWLADRYGRIAVMVVAAILFLVQSFGASFAATIVDLSVWRFIGGIAVGAASVIAPAYIAESSPALLRGRLGSFQQLAIVLGIFVAALSDFVISAVAGGANQPLLFGLAAWRWMFIVEAVPALIYLVGALQIPESPRYLVAHGLMAEARRVLAGIVGEREAAKRAAEIRRTVSTEHKPRFRDLSRRQLRTAAGRLDWNRPLGAAAVRRDQRDLLLLQRAAAGGRLHTAAVAHHHSHHQPDERGHDAGRDREHRPLWPKNRCS